MVLETRRVRITRLPSLRKERRFSDILQPVAEFGRDLLHMGRQRFPKLPCQLALLELAACQLFPLLGAGNL